MVLSKLSNILNDINTILLPQVCFGCNAHLRRGERLLCTLCRNQLPLTEYNFIDENPIDRIFYGRINIKKANSFLFYSEKGIVKTLIHYLKYKNQPQIGSFLGNWYGQILAETGTLNQIDLVVPVPLHWKKLRKRGYNQVSHFAELLAHYINARYIDDLLIKTANTKTQTGKGRTFRWQNDRDLYILSDPQLLKGKNVLLVDDVITTGATIEACGRALKSADDVNIYVVSMAVVP